MRILSYIGFILHLCLAAPTQLPVEVTVSGESTIDCLSIGLPHTVIDVSLTWTQMFCWMIDFIFGVATCNSGLATPHLHCTPTLSLHLHQFDKLLLSYLLLGFFVSVAFRLWCTLVYHTPPFLLWCFGQWWMCNWSLVLSNFSLDDYYDTSVSTSSWMQSSLLAWQLLINTVSRCPVCCMALSVAQWALHSLHGYLMFDAS